MSGVCHLPRDEELGQVYTSEKVLRVAMHMCTSIGRFVTIIKQQFVSKLVCLFFLPILTAHVQFLQRKMCNLLGVCQFFLCTLYVHTCVPLYKWYVHRCSEKRWRSLSWDSWMVTKHAQGSGLDCDWVHYKHLTMPFGVLAWLAGN